jgi:hypothetical protein
LRHARDENPLNLKGASFPRLTDAIRMKTIGEAVDRGLFKPGDGGAARARVGSYCVTKLDGSSGVGEGAGDE